MSRQADTLIDEGIKRTGEEINSVNRPDEIWIVDSRLAFSNIPDAFSVRLTTTRLGISTNHCFAKVPLFRVTMRGLLKLFQSDASTVRLGRSNENDVHIERGYLA